MTKPYPASADQTKAADNAPLNPRLIRDRGDDRTEKRPAAPLETVSVDEGQANPWPVIWLVVLAISLVLTALYIFG